MFTQSTISKIYMKIMTPNLQSVGKYFKFNANALAILGVSVEVQVPKYSCFSN